MFKVSSRSYFLLGMGIGAWLNIWPSLITHIPMASFIFAYILVFAGLWSVSVCDFVEKEKQ